MTSLTIDPAHQQLQSWSARLGQAAAGLPPSSPQPQPAPSRLSAALASLLHRARVRQEMMERLKAHEFVLSGR